MYLLCLQDKSATNTHNIPKPIGPPITNTIPLSMIIPKIWPPDNPSSSLTLLDGLAGFLAGCFLGGGLSGLSSSDSSESKSSS